MFRSIRGSLLAWYAAILVLVVVAFGGTLYYLLHRSMIDGVDRELRSHAQAIAGAIEMHRDGHFNLEISDEYQGYFQEGPYYVIWTPTQSVGPDVPRPDGPGVRDRGYAREVTVAGPGGTLVLVGRDIHDEHHRLQGFLRLVVVIGAGVLIFALAGGWFLAGRALAPIRRISALAAEMSASNLSRRIDEGRTESELGQLARALNEALDRLQESFDRQTRFTADASHELRTPLSILLSHVELALRKDRSAPEYRETLETCLRAAQRMRAVVEGLLTLARADAGELQLRKERVELSGLVGETVELLRPLAAERKVVVTASAQPAEIAGDRDRLREVVTNLVSNAIRYNREGGRVDVSLERDEGGIRLTVSDTGIGIPEKEQAHLFERFYRVDKARSREQGGSGLGLAITKWIVEAHGGSISVTSREGVGTTFSVRFP